MATTTRRQFLLSGGAAAFFGGSAAHADKGANKTAKDDDAVSPTEDLMREHGVLRRVLLVYGEVLRRFDARADVPADVLAHAATIIREFIEDYHEKDEE